MKQTPVFIAPVLGSMQSTVDTELYERSIERYDAGEHLEALHLLIDHLNPEFRTRYGNPEGTEFHIPHGSILVDITVRDERLEIVADFLHLPEKGRVAMLRQVCDLTLNRLMLPRFRKQGDRLGMEYRCPLSQSHPHKIYFILRNICHVGDRYDDEFCTKFGATRCYTPRITPYPAEEKARIVGAIRQVANETLDAVRAYESDRRYGYAWNVLDTAFYRIAFFAAPQGQLLNDLQKAVDDMDRELPVAELVAKGKVFLEQLAATGDEQLGANLYFVDTLVSTKRRSSLSNVQENFKDIYREAAEAIEGKDYERAAVRMLYKFYEMYFYTDVQDDVHRLTVRALEDSASQPMEKAAEILFEAVEKLMDDDLDDDAESDVIEAAATAAGQMAADMQAQIAGAQARMQEAMARGDMAEYMRLATELQQQVMQHAMGQLTDKA